MSTCKRAFGWCGWFIQALARFTSIALTAASHGSQRLTILRGRTCWPSSFVAWKISSPPFDRKHEPMSGAEPRNPFYLLLLVASLLFVLTCLAYGVVPILEQKAAAAGQPSPPSPFRDALDADGWKWLLYELAGMADFAALRMGIDRWQNLQNGPTTRSP